MTRKIFSHILPLFAVSLLFITALSLPTVSVAEEKISAKKPENIIADEPAIEDPLVSAEFEKIRSYVEMSLKAEAENVSQIQNRLADIEKLGKVIETEMNLYEIQLSGHSNLLLLPETRTEELIKAQFQHHTALKNTLQYINDIQTKLGQITLQQQQTAEQYSLNMSQLANLKGGEAENNPLTEILLKDLNDLIDLIEKKQELLQKIRQLYEKSGDELVKNRNHLTAFSEKIEKIIAEKKKKALFIREKNSIQSLNTGEMKDELFRIPAQAMTAVTGINLQIRETGFFLIVSVLFLLLIFLLLLFRFRSFCYSHAERHHLADYYPWRNFVLLFICKSLPLGGATCFIAVYGHIRNLDNYMPVFTLIIAALYTCLWTCWGLDFLHLWNAHQKKQIPASLQQYLENMLRIIRIFIIAILVLFWLNGSESTLLLPLRMSFYLVLLIFCLTFWREYRKHISVSEEDAVRERLYHRIIVGFSYTVPVGSIVLEFTGFGNMANFWFASWSFTSVSLLWTWLLFHLLREWGEKFRDSSLVTSTEKKDRRPLQWLAIQFCWLLWIQFLFFALSFSWHPNKSVIIGSYFNFLINPLPLPNIQISILALFYTVITLLITHAGVRIWRMMLGEKMLRHSGFDSGLKNSIIVFSSYLLWLLGILIALNMLGMEGQSFAVAFGGLGIGLGFGLQAIFNNFISGIIMLFERPIQVGDVVEVNGIWGEVKKINVRSTVVKTYDYASLIIPNSDMISNQLTNWSFNDKRVRRNVYVGVSYGSNVELVQETLLEIVRGMMNILKYPAPDVIFSDFGDSSLVFRLRYYTSVDDGLSADSAVRFEITRLFRERNIEIPFPQQDLHLRSVDRSISYKNISEPEEADGEKNESARLSENSLSEKLQPDRMKQI